MADFSCDSHGMLGPHARIGAAIHSARAVPPEQMPEVMGWSHHHGAPVHVHLSEQPLENAETRAAFGHTPSEVLEEAGVLGPRSTMVHATHLTERDISLLGESRTAVCMCPLTEADLADGVGPAPELAAAGCALSLGSDGHSAIDLLAEARWMELSQRLVSRRRGHFTAADQAAAATAAGHACLGWPDAGEVVPGAYADLVTLTLDTPRLAGRPPPLTRSARSSPPGPPLTSGMSSPPAATSCATGVTCSSTTCRARWPPRSARSSADERGACREHPHHRDRRARHECRGTG